MSIKELSNIPTKNKVRSSIVHNDPIDTVLHVIMVVSNPSNFKRRYQLAREFMERMKQEPSVQLYVVELCFPSQEFVLTQSNHPYHLQLRTDTPLWHKENLINCGVNLLPSSWKAMAWIDADIEFESATWATDCLRILNGYADIVQLFSHAMNMDKDEDAMELITSAGYQTEKKSLKTEGINYWHPGYGWACTRFAYEKMGGLYENGILGSGDSIMKWSLSGEVHFSFYGNENIHDQFKHNMYEFQSRIMGLRFSYVPGIIRHYYHGSMVNRRYYERWKILIDHQYCPEDHVEKNKDGILVPTLKCPPKLLEDIMNYFNERNEDE
jgi:hypothetical protein